jgi:hypothetical protein
MFVEKVKAGEIPAAFDMSTILQIIQNNVMFHHINKFTYLPAINIIEDITS